MIELLIKLNPSIIIPRKYKKLDWRLKTLKNTFGIQLEENPHFINILKSMEQIRHIIVHNNGLVDQAFINNTGYTHFSIGQKIIVENQMIGFAGYIISWIVRDISRATLRKYFKEFEKKTIRFEIRPGSIRENKE